MKKDMIYGFFIHLAHTTSIHQESSPFLEFVQSIKYSSLSKLSSITMTSTIAYDNKNETFFFLSETENKNGAFHIDLFYLFSFPISIFNLFI